MMMVKLIRQLNPWQESEALKWASGDTLTRITNDLLIKRVAIQFCVIYELVAN